MSLPAILWRLLAVFVIMAPAFYNGYPLVYSDTGTYLWSAMNLEIPKDRPVMYGLFIRYTSLHFSLWLVVLVQAWIVVYTSWHVARLLHPKLSYKTFLVLLGFLTWSTGLGWYTCQLMPDIFTPITVFCVLLLVFRERFSKAHQVSFFLLLILAVDVHFSNVLVALGVLAGLFIMTKTRLNPGVISRQLKFVLPTVAIVLSVGIVSLTNYAVGGTFKMNQGSHVFLTANLLNSGVLKSFLDDHCETGNYVLCPYKDSLPENRREFLWYGNSPLVKNGGWAATEGPYKAMIWDLMTSPKHLSMYVYNSLLSTIIQLFQNDIGAGLTPMANPNSPPYGHVLLHFPHEAKQYSQSLQNVNLWGETIDFSFVNRLNYWVLFLGLVVLVYLMGRSPQKVVLNPETKLIGWTLLWSIFMNALVIGFLASVYNRLQARISWIVVYTAILFLLSNRTVIFTQLKKDMNDFFNPLL